MGVGECAGILTMWGCGGVCGGDDATLAVPRRPCGVTWREGDWREETNVCGAALSHVCTSLVPQGDKGKGTGGFGKGNYVGKGKGKGTGGFGKGRESGKGSKGTSSLQGFFANV